MLTCSKCGAAYGDNFKYCPFCGEKSRQTEICPNCGSEVAEGSAYCNRCGSALNVSTVCKACGASNVSSAIYCNKCGAPLKSANTKAQDADRIKAVMPLVKSILETNSGNAQLADVQKTEQFAAPQYQQAQAQPNPYAQQYSQPMMQPIITPIIYPYYQGMPNNQHFGMQQPVQQNVIREAEVVRTSPVSDSGSRNATALQEPKPVVNNIYYPYSPSGQPSANADAAPFVATGKEVPIKAKKTSKRVNNITPIFALLFSAAFIVCMFMDFYFKGTTINVKGYEILGVIGKKIPFISGLYTESAGMAALISEMDAASGNIWLTILYWGVLGGVGLMSIIMVIDVLAAFIRIIRGRIARKCHKLIAVNFLFAIIVLCFWFAISFIASGTSITNFTAVAAPFFTMDATSLNTFDIYFLASIGAILLRFLTPFFAKKRKD